MNKLQMTNSRVGLAEIVSILNENDFVIVVVMNGIILKKILFNISFLFINLFNGLFI